MSLITQPTVEPITLAEAKSHLIVEHDDDNTLISLLIKSARQHVETVTRTSLIRQQHRLYLDKFKNVTLPFGPVQNIQQVQYVDENGDTQTLASTVYELDDENDKFLLAYDKSWPSTRNKVNAVWIDYWAGYFDSTESPIDLQALIPVDMKVATLMLIGDLYANRESNLDLQTYKNLAFDMLIGPHKDYMR